MEKIKQYKYVIIGVTVVVLLMVGIFLKPEDSVEINVPSIPTIEEETSYIYVDLKGEVKYPGVYKVEEGSRIFQLIRQSGGFTVKADTLAVNLSLKLYDQSVIYIPSFDDDYPNISEQQKNDVQVININQASIEQLMSLSGIGEVTAQAIIDYRNEQGGFSTIEDIMNVPGIGETTFEQIKNRLSVS